MPIPSKERVSELVGELVAQRGFDLEDVKVSLAGKHSLVRLMVDSDAGVSLDAVAELSREVSEVFDNVDDFGEAPYNLEVTTPGIDRPLTHERHWRRARGRKVRFEAAGEKVEGRIGAIADGTVDIVVRGKAGPSVAQVALADVSNAVVQVEFSRADPRELELTGFVAEGRPKPGERDDTIDVEDAEEEGIDK